MHLLLIEDHADLAANIGEYLAARGHALDQLAREIADSHRGLIEAKSLNLVITTLPTSIAAP